MRRILRETYFLLRPGFPWALRVALRRRMVKRLMRRVGGSWPINDLASRPPDWWTGWPEGKKFAFVLTHDVEARKGLEHSRELAELEMSLGFRSSFNFVPEGEYKTPKTLREYLAANGFEVGVHDLRHDGRLYRSRESFRKSAQKINARLAEWGAVGFRSGFMLHRFDWLQDIQALYDASSFDTDPFEPQPDGVNTIFPFWIGRADGSGYVEMPYTLPQDSTLFLILQQSGIEIWKRKLEWVASHGGMALINVHPDYMAFGNAIRSSEYSAQFYRDLLEYVRNHYREEAWFALPKDVAYYVRDMKKRSEAGASTSANVSGEEELPGGKLKGEAKSSFKIAIPEVREQQVFQDWRLQGKRVAMVMYSHYPNDPRPRRALETLVSKGVKVDLICIAEGKDDPKREVVNGIDVLRLPIRRRRGSVLRYGYEYGSFLLGAAAILSIRQMTRGYDLVYVHNMPDVLVFTGLVPKLFGARIILDQHDPMPELMTAIFGLEPEAFAVRLLKFFESLSIRFSDSVVTVNRACAKLFTSRSCPESKMHVVMNAPDESIFRLRPPRVRVKSGKASGKSFVMMYHGSIVPRNGLDLAVDALARVRKSIPDVELRIYGGRTTFLDEVLNQVRQNGLQDSVRYLGPKSLEDLVPAIEDCDVGVIPNQRSLFTELNTPTRIFEYLALGKPVIAPRAGGILDYFGEDELVLFELGDAGDLAKKIEYVHSHSQEANEIAIKGQAVYCDHRWTAERMRLTTLVASLLTEGKTEGDSAERALYSGESALP